MSFRRLSDVDVRGKRVLVRADLNVPQDDAGGITDDTRIRASVPGIRDALARGAAVMVTSHLGRPTEGEWKPGDSLAPIATRLGELLGRDVPLVRDWIDGGAWHDALKPGDLVMLENCRINKGEKKDDDALARRMARLCDVYVNDAFGTAHRAEATTHGIASHAPSACAAAGGDRRRIEGVHQADDPARARREGRHPDRRRRHRQHLHPGRRRTH